MNKDAKRFGVDYGVKIVVLKSEVLKQTYGIKNGDIILDIEDQKVKTVAEVEMLLKKYQNKEYVVLQIITQNGRLGYVRLRNN